MAEPKKTERLGNAGGTKDLKQDEVIERLVPDPADPPDVIAMIGFVGKSTRARFWRVYHTLDLKNYVEIAEDDIVHSQSLTTDQQRLGGTVIWMRANARLRYSRNESRQAEADFIRGDITRNFLAATGAEGLARIIGPNVVFTTNTRYGPGACCSKKLTCPVEVFVTQECSTD